MNRVMTRERQHALAHGTPEGQALLGGTQLNRSQDIADSQLMGNSERNRRNGFSFVQRMGMRAFHGCDMSLA